MKLKLKTIIAEFISAEDLSEHQFNRLWNIGVRGAREFQMDIYGAFKSVLLEVEENKTVNLPCDYMTYSKIGVLNDAGEVLTLKRNDGISGLHSQYITSKSELVDVPMVDSIVNLSDPSRFPFFWLNYAGFGSGGGYHLYGLQGGTATVGQYRLDEDAGLIYLDANWPFGTIMLEYLSDGYDTDCDDYMVDVKASECMHAWLRWQNAVGLRKKYSQGDVMSFRQEYYNQRRLSKTRLNKATIAEMQTVFRSKVKLAAKA